MDEDPLLAHAVGELILFAASRGAAATDLWETKASEDAKHYRTMWQDTSPEQYQKWSAAQGVQPAVTHIVGHAAVQARILVQAEEERTGQAWPGRKLVRPFPEDAKAVRDRRRAAARRRRRTPRPVARRRRRRPNNRLLTRQQCTWDDDNCRHGYPKSLISGPGVLTFMCR